MTSISGSFPRTEAGGVRTEPATVDRRPGQDQRTAGRAERNLPQAPDSVALTDPAYAFAAARAELGLAESVTQADDWSRQIQQRTVKAYREVSRMR